VENPDPIELQITERLKEHLPPQATLTLPFQQRQKSRLRTRLDSGEDAGLFLPRGTVLRHGDRLRATNGLIVEVRAASESVSTAHTEDPVSLARVAYHLGNRHIALQIGAGWLRYAQDDVMDRLVKELGLNLITEAAPFEPEPGAYGSDDHQHY
jgi:urease accessory protein